MLVRDLLATFALVLGFAALGFGQAGDKSKPFSSSDAPLSIKSSPAYAELLLRKTELLADLEAFGANYTEANPKVLDTRAELASLDKSLERMLSVPPSETGKLTLALGKLVVRKAALDTEVSRLLRSYTKDQPEVKRAARRVEVFDSAINEILK